MTKETLRNGFNIFCFLFIVLLLILFTDKQHEYNETVTVLNNKIESYSNKLNRIETGLIGTQDDLSALNVQLQCLENSFDLLSDQVNYIEYNSTDLGTVLNLSESDIEYFAKLLYREGGYEPFECKMSICFVVLNRVLSNKFPNNLVDVINDEGQFQPVITGSINSATPTDDCYYAIDMVLSMNYCELADRFGDVYFFRAATKEKVFGSNTKFKQTLGNTDFYEYK